MAAPGAVTLNSLTAQAGALDVAYTQALPANTELLEVQFKPEDLDTWRTFGTVQPTGCRLYALAPNVIYSVRVRATSADGVGAWSNVLQAVPLRTRDNADLARMVEHLLPGGPAFKL